MSLLARLFGLRRSEVLTAEWNGEDLQVLRGGGVCQNPAIEEAVLSGVQFSPEAGRFQLAPDAEIREAGVQVRIRQ